MYFLARSVYKSLIALSLFSLIFTILPVQAQYWSPFGSDIKNTNTGYNVLLSSGTKLGLGTDSPQKNIHLFDPLNPTIQFNTTVASDATASSYLSLISDPFQQTYTTLPDVRPGDFLIASTPKTHSIILTTRQQSGEIRFATTEAVSGSPVEIERMRIFSDGQVRVGLLASTFDAMSSTAKLKVQENVINRPAFLADGGNRALFIGAQLSDIAYNPLVKAGDVGIFFTDENKGTATQSANLVIAPWSNVLDAGIRMLANGNVGIGVQNPEQKLVVNGTICAKEVHIALTGTGCWSDFVFAKNYNLRSLEEVEKYINQNGHLPEIPTEKEVVENGIALGEIQAKLLQKIEELTLYVIDLKKDNVTLTHRLGSLERKSKRSK